MVCHVTRPLCNQFDECLFLREPKEENCAFMELLFLLLFFVLVLAFFICAISLCTYDMKKAILKMRQVGR
jgi:hypothetical protein